MCRRFEITALVHSDSGVKSTPHSVLASPHLILAGGGAKLASGGREGSERVGKLRYWNLA